MAVSVSIEMYHVEVPWCCTTRSLDPRETLMPIGTVRTPGSHAVRRGFNCHAPVAGVPSRRTAARGRLMVGFVAQPCAVVSKTKPRRRSWFP